MPFDTIVDSAALYGAMTATADVIRAKTGDTGAVNWDPAIGFTQAIAGIVSGGGGLAYDMGEFVLDADIAYLDTKDGIPHKLGEKPDFVLVWTDDFADLSADNVASQTVNIGYIILLGLFGLPQRLSSAATNTLALHNNYHISANDYRVTIQAPTSAAYSLQNGTLPSATAIPLFKFGGSYLWKAGVTYKYFVSRAWWNVGGTNNAE